MMTFKDVYELPFKFLHEVRFQNNTDNGMAFSVLSSKIEY